MAVCPHCGKVIDSGRPFGPITDSILLIDHELTKELTQDQRITLLVERSRLQMFKRKMARKAYIKGPKRKRKKKVALVGSSALDSIFGVPDEPKTDL